jgi:hypothetical protein
MMTEIRNEKQKPAWPWILGLIVFGGIIYFFFFRDNGNMTAGTDGGLLPGKEVRGYLQLVENDTDTMGLSPDYTNEAIIRLTEASRAAALQNDVDVNEDLTSAQNYPGNFTQETFNTSRADTIRVVTGHLATALIKIQEAK